MDKITKTRKLRPVNLSKYQFSLKVSGLRTPYDTPTWIRENLLRRHRLLTGENLNWVEYTKRPEWRDAVKQEVEAFIYRVQATAPLLKLEVKHEHISRPTENTD